MNQQRWRALDSGLLGLVGVALVGLLVVRFLWVGSYLPVVLRAWEQSDARLPFFTRLTLSSEGFYAGVGLTVVFASAGAAVRARGARTAGRTLLLLAAFAGASGAALDVAGVWTAMRAAPHGLVSCPCTGKHECVGRTCTCSCNDRGWIVQQRFLDAADGTVTTEIVVEHDRSGAVTAFTVDGDGDGRAERRCVYDRPCPQGGEVVGCQMRCHAEP